jgi:hypothetical protein
MLGVLPAGVPVRGNRRLIPVAGSNYAQGSHAIMLSDAEAKKVTGSS